ncbi:4-hydroxythreonine-4-phosphate dehydrogenase PdxA [Chenggangzhangella methanolivorans]|uniref:4-hydroxythreonine-4-phosphate dehydrogenase n=1 Tax=Chenggangzhangella methanolivorans TaxID=1437009 RepID=A0A9E6REG0_9HYPH|nr:4-hydroxythreonine-4-phosphate dehydrogenase PdxA [Chenggangzhangella methanolivorans]QZN99705.1 4-hydroxythreonine-4-phosphate dehydrogenase PdxA [Chenggangzhangella methanolivorans]
MSREGALTRPLALSMGEPAGVGPELALALWRDRDRLSTPPFTVLGCPATFAARARLVGIDAPIAEVEPEGAPAVFADRFPVTPVGRCVAEPGKPNSADAKTVIEAIRLGVELVHGGRCSALVTLPIAKAPLVEAGFPHPGHTEYLGALSETLWGRPFRAVMLLWAEEIAVVPVTVHMPLREACERLTEDDIVATGEIVARDLCRRFRIERPRRLAVAGLNPHAGENGVLGHEDDAIVAPAVERLKAEGIIATGPHPADTMFHAAARARYDAALAMYHDQALIPVKTLAFDRAVNVTLGLPFVRTSPDHGTAFDIAGTGAGDPSSLLAALRLAARMAREPALA